MLMWLCEPSVHFTGEEYDQQERQKDCVDGRTLDVYRAIGYSQVPLRHAQRGL